MIVDCLLDTNILVYAVDSTPVNSGKSKRAVDLIEKSDFGLSAQIMQEFYVTVTRKFQKPLSPDSAASFMEQMSVFPLVPTDYSLIIEGARQFNQIPYFVLGWCYPGSC